MLTHTRVFAAHNDDLLQPLNTLHRPCPDHADVGAIEDMLLCRSLMHSQTWHLPHSLALLF